METTIERFYPCCALALAVFLSLPANAGAPLTQWQSVRSARLPNHGRDRPLDAKVAALVAAMTLEQKIDRITQADVLRREEFK